MANLYDKIRKKKKENLEEMYKNLSKPKSMAESVAKFKNVDSSTAYGGGDALANPQAAIKGGANIESQAKNKAEDQGKCVQGFIVGGPNNGEECSDKPKLSSLKDKVNESVSNAKERIGELTESRDDVNQDMEEGDKKLFGKQKGGSKIGNLLRSVVGESGIKKMMKVVEKVWVQARVLLTLVVYNMNMMFQVMLHLLRYLKVVVLKVL